MIWLQSTPWLRWFGAMVLAALALWIELRPEPTIQHPFAIVDIEPGAVIDGSNTEGRPVAAGVLTPVEAGAVARSTIVAGDPVLPSDTDQGGTSIPAGWWAIEARLPTGARTGDRARLVLLDSGALVEAVVIAAAVDDPLGSGMGMVAVEPDHSAEAAIAAAEGRIAVMVAPG